jgi:hypothetical protein
MKAIIGEKKGSMQQRMNTFRKLKTYPYIWTILAFVLMGQMGSFGQNPKNEDLIQLSGVVASGDTLEPIPYVNIFVKNRRFGTITDFDGFFSIVVAKGDSIEFSHMGYNSEVFVVPDSLPKKHYSLIQILISDTLLLPVTDVYPWPSKEQFKDYFMSMEVPMDDYDRANRNMAMETIRLQAERLGYDADMIGRYTIQMHQQQLWNANRYYGQNGGQAILGTLSNPFAWAEFFKALKRGDFNKKQ